ncbi:MAG: transposase [Patescibacteria group bacterium]|nr:transposase [Patescibacteria group bacterium]
MYDPEKHHRRSIRLKNYDYSQNGAYSITICAQNREHFFGEIINEKMILNDAGIMVNAQWNDLINRFSNIHLDQYILMPNHFHCILIINDQNDSRQAQEPAPTIINPRQPDSGQAQGLDFDSGQPRGLAPTIIEASTDTPRGYPYPHPQPSNFGNSGRPQRPAPTIIEAPTKKTIGDIIGAFKSITTNEYINGVKNKGWKTFNKRLWQRNYYEHIIRNENELHRIREYIINNPRNWGRNKKSRK